MQCGYCDQNQDNLLATCMTCHQQFCNTSDKPSSLSHILKHLKETQHNQFSVPAIGELRCQECGRSNILDLFKDKSGNIFCREHQVADCNQIVLGKKMVDIFDQYFTDILPDVKQGIQLQDKTDGTCSDGKYQEMEYIDGQDQIWQAEGDNSPEVESPPGINTKDVKICSNEQGQQINSKATSIITTADSIISEMRINEEKQRGLVVQFYQQENCGQQFIILKQLKALKASHTEILKQLLAFYPNHQLITSNYTFDEAQLPETEKQVQIIINNLRTNEEKQRLLIGPNQQDGSEKCIKDLNQLKDLKETHNSLMTYLRQLDPNHELIVTNYTFDEIQSPSTEDQVSKTLQNIGENENEYRDLLRSFNLENDNNAKRMLLVKLRKTKKMHSKQSPSQENFSEIKCDQKTKSTPPVPPTLPQPLSADLLLAEKIKLSPSVLPVQTTTRSSEQGQQIKLDDTSSVFITIDAIISQIRLNEDQQRGFLVLFTQSEDCGQQLRILKQLKALKATHTQLLNQLLVLDPNHQLITSNYTFDEVKLPQTSQQPNATKIAKSTPQAPPQPLSPADILLAEKIKQLVSKIQLPDFVKVTELNQLIGLKVQNTTKVAKSYITDTLDESDISDYEELATNVLSMLGIDINELQPKSQVVQPGLQGKKQPVQDNKPGQKKTNNNINKVQEPVKKNQKQQIITIMRSHNAFTVVDFEAYATCGGSASRGGYSARSNFISEFGAVRVQNGEIVATIDQMIKPSKECLSLPEKHFFMPRKMTQIDAKNVKSDISEDSIKGNFKLFSSLSSQEISSIPGVKIFSDFPAVTQMQIFAKGPGLEKRVLGIEIINSDDICTGGRKDYHGKEREFCQCEFHKNFANQIFTNKGREEVIHCALDDSFVVAQKLIGLLSENVE